MVIESWFPESLSKTFPPSMTIPRGFPPPAVGFVAVGRAGVSGPCEPCGGPVCSLRPSAPVAGLCFT